LGGPPNEPLGESLNGSPIGPLGGLHVGPYLGGRLLYGGFPPMGTWMGHPWKP